MLGQVRYPALQFQLDTGGALRRSAGRQSEAPVVDTLKYRKVQGLEADPLVLDLIRRDVFREICAGTYGKHASVSIFRAMMMNKPARQGTHLPWHQDAGDVWKLDRDPLVTIWIALDPATRANGCLEVDSRQPPTGAAQQERQHHQRELMRSAIVLRTRLPTWKPRRARRSCCTTGCSIAAASTAPTPPAGPSRACYMDGRTISTLTGNRFPIVFGEHEVGRGVAVPAGAQRRESAPETAALKRNATPRVSSRTTTCVSRCAARRKTYAKSLEAELTRHRSHAAPSIGAV